MNLPRNLLKPLRIGRLEIPNRLMHSATFEGMANEQGLISGELIKRYRTLARSGLGLIVPGHMYVSPEGRAERHQTGIATDAAVPGLKDLVRTVHEQGGRIIFQLAHAGRQTTRKLNSARPISPSARGRDPVNLVRPREMTEHDIESVITAFEEAARRAAEAGADGVQLHAAHGYLLNQFLSPFFNRRQDAWGGSARARFTLLREVLAAVRGALPERMPVMVKLNTEDHTPEPGITPELAVRYATWLAELGIDAIEVSSGTVLYSFMNMCRGEVPASELISTLPVWKRPVGHLIMRRLVGRHGFDGPYHVETARLIRQAVPSVPLAVVGGMRRAAEMEQLVTNGPADLVSMSRPLLRQPMLARRIAEDPETIAACESCNRCLAGVTAGLPTRCYVKGLP